MKKAIFHLPNLGQAGVKCRSTDKLQIKLHSIKPHSTDKVQIEILRISERVCRDTREQRIPVSSYVTWVRVYMCQLDKLVVCKIKKFLCFPLCCVRVIVGCFSVVVQNPTHVTSLLRRLWNLVNGNRWHTKDTTHPLETKSSPSS